MNKRYYFYTSIFIFFFVAAGIVFLLFSPTIKEHTLNKETKWKSIKSSLCRFSISYPKSWEQFDIYEKRCLLSFRKKSNPATGLWINSIREEDGTFAQKEEELKKMSLSKSNNLFVSLNGKNHLGAYKEDGDNASIITYFSNMSTVYYVSCRFKKTDTDSKKTCTDILGTISLF